MRRTGLKVFSSWEKFQIVRCSRANRRRTLACSSTGSSATSASRSQPSPLGPNPTPGVSATPLSFLEAYASLRPSSNSANFEGTTNSYVAVHTAFGAALGPSRIAAVHTACPRARPFAVTRPFIVTSIVAASATASFAAASFTAAL